MKIQNHSVQALLDEIYKAYLEIPSFTHFQKGDYETASRFPDKSLPTLIHHEKIRTEYLEIIQALRSIVNLSNYDRLLLDLAAYFLDYVMFPVSPLLEKFYYLIFGITPYEMMVEPFWDQLYLFDCSSPENVRKHVALTADYARYAKQLHDKVFEQAERGIFLFAGVIPSTIQALKIYAAVTYDCHPLNMLRPGSAATTKEISLEQAYVRQASKYFLDIVEFLGSEDYLQKAPQGPGWGQFHNGLEYYRFLRQYHLGYDLKASELHALGLQLLTQATAQQAAIRERLGYDCPHATFIHQLRGKERFFPTTPDSLGALMNAIKEKLEASTAQYFKENINTPCVVKRLDPEIEKSLTFGYFQPSIDRNREAVYYYNASGLSEKCQITSPALLAHELFPGHHFHQSYTSENEDMHPLIKAIISPTCLEGWAEYSAFLMTEVGVFDDYDEYGRLENDKFGCARLVVDTGLNELGWSMEQARQFLLDHTFVTPQMAESETIRYAYCIPAQALAYKFGNLKLMELRDRYKTIRGEKYERREFHSLILNSGIIPLPLLESYIMIAAGQEGHA